MKRPAPEENMFRSVDDLEWLYEHAKLLDKTAYRCKIDSLHLAARMDEVIAEHET